MQDLLVPKREIP